MKNTRIFLTALVAVALAGLPVMPVKAQRADDADRPSKHGKAVVAIGDTQVTVDYGRPRTRGREIFGELVPFGEVWVPGANEATEITFSTAVVIDDQLIPAGTYTLWASPGKEEWTLLLNSETGIWHTTHKAEHDVYRFTVQPWAADHFEALTYLFTHVTQESAELVLRWDKLAVPLTITIPTTTKD